MSRSSWVLKGLIVHPGVIDEDYTGEIKIMVSLSSGTIILQPKIPIAQLILLPRSSTNNPAVKGVRGAAGFGSTDAYWMKAISSEKPYLTMFIHGRPFKGLVDTGADVSVISAREWPMFWPSQGSDVPVKGVGHAVSPKISSNILP